MADCRLGRETRRRPLGGGTVRKSVLALLLSIGVLVACSSASAQPAGPGASLPERDDDVAAPVATPSGFERGGAPVIRMATATPGQAVARVIVQPTPVPIP